MHGGRSHPRWGCEGQGWGWAPVFSICVRHGNGAMAKRGFLGPSQQDKYKASNWHLRSPQWIQSAPIIQGHAHSPIPFAIQHSILQPREPGVEDVVRSIALAMSLARDSVFDRGLEPSRDVGTDASGKEYEGHQAG